MLRRAKTALLTVEAEVGFKKSGQFGNVLSCLEQTRELVLHEWYPDGIESTFRSALSKLHRALCFWRFSTFAVV